jgi:hypothetical protein
MSDFDNIPHPDNTSSDYGLVLFGHYIQSVDFTIPNLTDARRKYGRESRQTNSTFCICLESWKFGKKVHDSAAAVFAWDGKDQVYFSRRSETSDGSIIKDVMTFWNANKGKLDIYAEIDIFMYCVAFMYEMIFDADRFGNKSTRKVTREMIINTVNSIKPEHPFFVRLNTIKDAGSFDIVEIASIDSIIELINSSVEYNLVPRKIYKDDFEITKDSEIVLDWINFELVTKSIYSFMFNKTVTIKN